ncbi:hypothetical protein [Streptomyces endophytica]|uniref:Uncharacterized protein n=1 Tax=Streptomyces endophytica TaxID=2991496 RepID=A0ABY6PHL7_9ACTN|nr:hypothetical protein [Streptomyces endophytica]UZJ33389.1 hypothetical protein OJ254_27810 [Streptomyces endophytica]
MRALPATGGRERADFGPAPGGGVGPHVQDNYVQDNEVVKRFDHQHIPNRD